MVMASLTTIWPETLPAPLPTTGQRDANPLSHWVTGPWFSRFVKCYVMRRGYREGGYGFLIALFAGLYPLLSYLKARYEDG